ncbi:MAG: hypothetical protein ACKVIX_02610 [Sphingomonadales bacterium]
MRDFFQKILPKNGWYFIAAKKGKGKMIHFAFKNFGEMVEKAKELDALGYDTYFACASFKKESYFDSKDHKTKKRTAENAGWATAFWIDLDCGPDKAKSGEGYLKKKEALIALDNFIKAVGLPDPYIVHSGGGFHIYFLLNKTITKEEWRPVATKLKELTHCPKIKLLADDKVTADIARILRPIGTHNYKPERRGAEVTRVLGGKPVTFKEFSKTINAAHKKYCGVKKLPSKQLEMPDGLKYSAPETLENIEKVKSALSGIDPDCGYDTWLENCFALNSTRWECAEELARTWSKGELK